MWQHIRNSYREKNHVCLFAPNNVRVLRSPELSGIFWRWEWGKCGKIYMNSWYMQIILQVISLYCSLGPAQSFNSQVCFFCFPSFSFFLQRWIFITAVPKHSKMEMISLLITFYLLFSTLANVFLPETVENCCCKYVFKNRIHRAAGLLINRQWGKENAHP